MFCKNCGSQLPENVAYCPNCGAPVESETKQEQTSAPNPEPTPVQNGAPLGGQDKLTIILLCLFLGSIGIHNFVMGENKKGIVKIVLAFCFGISAIFALIDLVKILIGKYTVDPTKLI